MQNPYRKLRRKLAEASAAAVLISTLSFASTAAPDSRANISSRAQRPAFSPFLRQNEDWSALAHPAEGRPRDLFDRFKYIPLSDDGEIWASFGGQARVRVENWNRFNFATSDSDETFALFRVLLHSDIHVGETFRLFLEGKSAEATKRDLPGGRRQALDVDSLALQQAFVDLTLPLGDSTSITLRPGRQMFVFGKQRLVSPLPWANNLRTWDGVSAEVKAGGWNVTPFWTLFVPTRKHQVNNPSTQRDFYGVYGTGPTPFGEIRSDLYFLGIDDDRLVSFNQTRGSEERFTIGGRLWGSVTGTPVDWEMEGAYQFGEVGNGEISAFMFASVVGYSLAELLPSSPRLTLAFDYASGDRSPGGNVNTFNPLFPLGHAYFGFIDAVGRQNIIDLSPGITFKPLQKLTMALTGHMFWLADTSDALYNAGGGITVPAGVGSNRNVGSEVDLTFTYQLDRHNTAEFGYNHFLTGDLFDQASSSRNSSSDFLYFQWTLIF